MASLSTVRRALKSTITDAIPSLTGYETVPGQVNLPAFIVLPRSSDFLGAMGRGNDTYEFDVIVLVSRRDDGLAQDELDEFVNGFGDKSARAAIFATPSLGLANTHAVCVGMDRYGGSWDVGDTPHVGAALQVRVMTSGTA